MKYAADLTDLLNHDPQAYTYFYALPAQTQTDLRKRDIRSMEELKQATADLAYDNRPRAFGRERKNDRLSAVIFPV